MQLVRALRNQAVLALQTGAGGQRGEPTRVDPAEPVAWAPWLQVGAGSRGRPRS